MTMGIYEIKNLKNKKVYIGQSKNIEKRFLNHKKLLRDGSHYNAHLQNSFNLHGEEYFFFHILEEIDNPILLNEAENKWIGYYDSFAGVDGYNIKYPTKVFRSSFQAPNTKCKNCGKIFYSKRNNAKFCSSKCSKDYWNRNYARIKPKKKKHTKQGKLSSCNRIFLANWGEIELAYYALNKRLEKIENRLGLDK